MYQLLQGRLKKHRIQYFFFFSHILWNQLRYRWYAFGFAHSIRESETTAIHMRTTCNNIHNVVVYTSCLYERALHIRLYTVAPEEEEFCFTYSAYVVCTTIAVGRHLWNDFDNTDERKEKERKKNYYILQFFHLLLQRREERGVICCAKTYVALR